MNLDISALVDGWPYDDNVVKARWIQGVDGRKKVQLRMDLGVFQMEIEGRPDGTRPNGEKSLLAFYRKDEKKSPAGSLSYPLGLEACDGLRAEFLQYQHRTEAFYALHWYDGVIQDCKHNLDLIRLASQYAVDDETAWQFLQVFPYVRAMSARATAEMLLDTEQHRSAIIVLQEAISEITAFLNEHYEPINEDGSPVSPNPYLQELADMLEDIEKSRPRTAREVLSEELTHALEIEDYERAATLRDQLQQLKPDSLGLGKARGKKKSGSTPTGGKDSA